MEKVKVKKRNSERNKIVSALISEISLLIQSSSVVGEVIRIIDKEKVLVKVVE